MIVLDMGDIVHIVQYALNKDLSKDSVHYVRFVTHVRFFVERFFLQIKCWKIMTKIFIYNIKKDMC